MLGWFFAKEGIERENEDIRAYIRQLYHLKMNLKSTCRTVLNVHALTEETFWGGRR